MKKIIFGTTLLAAGIAAQSASALTLEQRLPPEAKNSDAQIQKLIQRMAVIAVLKKPSTPVYDKNNLAADGTPIDSQKGTAAGIGMNDLTGAGPDASKNGDVARFVKPRATCTRQGAINSATRTAIYSCSVSTLSVNIDQPNWKVLGDEPETSRWMDFQVEIKAEASGDTDYDSNLVSNYLTWNMAG